MKAFSTEAFARRLHTRNFSRKDFLHQASASGAEAIEVEARFFTERAMYWTRMFRAEAEAEGMRLTAIVCDSELATADRHLLQAAQADICEWIRIAALSEISMLRIRLDRVGEDAPCDVETLREALAPLATLAERYGVMLALSDKSGSLGDQTLLALAKAIGYSVARVVTRAPLGAAEAMWTA